MVRSIGSPFCFIVSIRLLTSDYELGLKEIGKVGDYLNLSINTEKRNKIRANHSATHLLQYALRKIFGATVMQKGSSVDENRLRFDFTLNRSVAREHIKEIENIENAINYVNFCYNEDKNFKLSAHFLKELHTLITKDLKIEGSKESGKFRSCNVKINHAIHVPPDMVFVNDYMER